MLKKKDYEHFLVNGVLAFITASILAGGILFLMGISPDTCNVGVLCGGIGVMAVILWLSSITR